MNILLSIKPKWAKAIYSGEKKIEWRKNVPKNFNIEKDEIFLYESSPICKVTGIVKIKRFFEVPQDYLKSIIKYDLFSIRYFVENGLLTEKELLKYSNNNSLYGWEIDKFYTMYHDEIKKFSPNEKPPQSWCYTKAFIYGNTLNFDHQIKYED